MVSYEKDVVVAVSLAPRDAPDPTTSPSAVPLATADKRPAGPRPVKPAPLGIDEKDPYKR
jgi:hypothetical protein